MVDRCRIESRLQKGGTLKKTITTLLFLIAWLGLSAQQEAQPWVTFHPQGGFFRAEVEVQLLSEGATIYYTTDGSRPTRRSKVYKAPFRLSNTAVVRAIAYANGKSSQFFGQTYFINEPETNFAVVSIGITPRLLFDPAKGLFMQGNQLLDESWKKPGANFWSMKEVTAHVELFESDGQAVHNSLSGFRLFGGMSRLFPQKSITLVARERYGAKRFEYPIFGVDGEKDFKFLVLRNSGSDWGKTHFRDALMTSLIDGWDMEKQDYRPAHVYINGKYWGIYNIREKINRYFIADHNKGIDKDSIDFLEHNMIRRRGSRRSYQKMIDFIAANSLRAPAHYAYVKSLMDVDNFMNYQIAQIYFDNQDAGGNIKYWRPQTPDGRWRWILYDTDWGFGLHDQTAYLNNSLAFHTEPQGPSWPNPPWSTFLLRKLLENPSFERAFINRFADHLNTSFEPKRVALRIDAFYQQLAPEIPRHLARWRLSQQKWEEEVQTLYTFATERPFYSRLHLMDQFNTGGLRILQVQAEGGGSVLINEHIEVGAQPFEGKYFEKIPVSLKIVPHNGYRFVRWEGVNASADTREITLKLGEDITAIKAVFEKYEHPLAGKVVINEVSPNNKKSGDWIELFNHTKEPVSLRDWILSDRKNDFIFPNVRIAPKDYLVICEDAQRFYAEFPNAYNVVDGLHFGLNKRSETLQLFAPYGAVVDSIAYEILPTDSVFVWSLLLPNLDNSDTENWEVRRDKGSPNAPNPFFLESSIRLRQKEWMQVGLATGVVLLCFILLVLRHRKLL